MWFRSTLEPIEPFCALETHACGHTPFSQSASRPCGVDDDDDRGLICADKQEATHTWWSEKRFGSWSQVVIWFVC